MSDIPPRKSDVEDPQVPTRPPKPKLTDDWAAILIAGLILTLSCGSVWLSRTTTDNGDQSFGQPLKPMIAKPATWTESPIDAFLAGDAGSVWEHPATGIAGTLLILLILTTFGRSLQGRGGVQYALAFVGLFALATIAYLLAAQSVVKSFNLEYALWALAAGLVISNTVGTPQWLRPAVSTEFFIKTGLVLLGAEVLMSRLLALGIPGVFVAWVVTPIVLISTYAFGQKILKMESRSLNMVISADMSVCGVSAAIASAAACKAKKEELSLAIGMSLSFTVLMMVAMPLLIRAIGLDETVAGAWLGGTIDSTGAVAVAGATLGDRALEVAATVKMIQNILIGVSAFGIATYWVTYVERDRDGASPQIGEIWRRFPRFVLGFICASIVFSAVHGLLTDGPELVDAMIKGSTKTLRGWFFCLAFVSIGLETRFKELLPFFKGGKPLILYLCGQTLNIVLTLIMAYLMFGVLFKDFIAP